MSLGIILQWPKPNTIIIGHTQDADKPIASRSVVDIVKKECAANEHGSHFPILATSPAGTKHIRDREVAKAHV